MTTYNHSLKQISNIIETKFLDPKLEKKVTEVERLCMMPCTKMTNILSLMDGENGRADTVLEFRFQKRVRVEKKMIVYTWFNFIIDIGTKTKKDAQPLVG